MMVAELQDCRLVSIWMLYLIFVRLTGWLALTWIRRGLPASVALSALTWPGSSRCPNRPSGERGAAPGSR